MQVGSGESSVSTRHLPLFSCLDLEWEGCAPANSTGFLSSRPAKFAIRYWTGKFKVAIFKVNINDEYFHKLTSWLSYVFDHKMRTGNKWDAIEPILELRKAGKL